MNASHQLVHGAIASLLVLGLGVAGGTVTNKPENVRGGAAAVKKG
jgi:hypothetical protein